MSIFRFDYVLCSALTVVLALVVFNCYLEWSDNQINLNLFFWDLQFIIIDCSLSTSQGDTIFSTFISCKSLKLSRYLKESIPSYANNTFCLIFLSRKTQLFHILVFVRYFRSCSLDSLP